MDIFNEQIVVRKEGAKEITLLLLTYIASFILAVVFIFMGTIFIPLSFILFCMAFGAIALGWFLGTKQYVEFEYSVTNGELDIDKIVAKRKRTRIITVKSQTFETGGVFVAEKHAHANYRTRIYAGEDLSQNNMFVTFNHHKLGSTLLVFSPNEKIVESLRPFMSRNIELHK